MPRDSLNPFESASEFLKNNPLAYDKWLVETFLPCGAINKSPENPIVKVDKKCKRLYILKYGMPPGKRIEWGTRQGISAGVELYPCEYAEAARATSVSRSGGIAVAAHGAVFLYEKGKDKRK
jgi:hypothetical protein